MRSPLDKACDDQRDAFQESISEAHKLGIKTGADWQLEQVTEWLKVELRRSSTFKGYSVIDNDNFFKDLEKAMRPEDNND